MINDHRVILFSIGNGAHTPGLISDATGFKRGKIGLALTKLVAEGHVIRRARGYYTLPVTVQGAPVVNQLKPEKRWYARFFE